jgi:hypothetical protein
MAGRSIALARFSHSNWRYAVFWPGQALASCPDPEDERNRRRVRAAI